MKVRVSTEFEISLTLEEIQVRIDFVRRFLNGATITVEKVEPPPKRRKRKA